MTRTGRIVAGTLAAALLLASCVSGGAAPERLRIVVPTPPGGGFDITARSIAVAMRQSGIAEDVGVINLPGEVGMSALSRVRYERGNDELLLQMGLGVVANAHIAGFTGAIEDLTPVARLIEEQEAIVVPSGSPYRDIGALLDDLRSSSGVTVGGGSQRGGPDHLAAMLLAKAIGLSPKELNYEPSDGGGDLLAALLSHQVDFAVTGAGEHLHAVRAGEVRVLAVTGSDRVPGIDAPTLRESGVDLEFMNWRGLLAPPGLTAEQRDALLGLIDRLRATAEWRSALQRYNWTESYLSGAEFGQFVRSEDARVRSVIDELGLSDAG